MYIQKKPAEIYMCNYAFSRNPGSLWNFWPIFWKSLDFPLKHDHGRKMRKNKINNSPYFLAKQIGSITIINLKLVEKSARNRMK